MDTPIKRHIKIRGDVTPYSPGMEIYFERRLDLIWTGKLKKMQTLAALWKRQGKCCPRCRQLITNQTGRNIHHRLRKVMGGSDDMSNLELLHPNCHRQLHSREAGAHTRSEKLRREVEQAEALLKQREQESDRYSGREDDPQVPRQLRQSRHRRPLPAHLPREIHRLEPEESCCPECGGELDYLGEVSLSSWNW